MNTRNRWLRWLVGVILVATVILYFCRPSEKDTARLPVKWAPQPDSFPLGTVLQGSTVEMSLGLFSTNKPPPPPSWVSRLPQPIRRRITAALERRRARATARTWQVKVDAPDFVYIDEAEIDYHSTHGAFPTVHMHLATDQPGDHEEPLRIRLLGQGYATNTVVIPIRVKILAKLSRWTVLVTDTPFERYSTDDGRDYEALTAITSRLAEQGVRVDFRYHLPTSLEVWNVILLAGDTMADLDAQNMARLQRFVARGGRLLVSADAFFDQTAANSNGLLNRYGLRIDTKDAGQTMQTSQIASDPLTAGVTHLSFHRPASVWITDSKQAKLLAAMEEDERRGFIAVSRASGRGEVILLAQSLWWNWVKLDPGAGENARMLENLLAP